MARKREINSYRNGHFEGLITYYTENKNAPNSHVTSRAIHAFYETNEYGLETYTVRDAPFERDMGEFMYTVEDEAGIKEFYLCDQSTGLMGTLHYLMNTGWQIIGPFEKQVDPFTTLRGLHMQKA